MATMTGYMLTRIQQIPMNGIKGVRKMIAMKNFEMPNNCNRCDLTNECGLCLVDNGSCDYDSRYRPTTCPLVEVGKWIPCSERMPEADEYIGNVPRYYLVQNEYGDMLVARYTHREYWEQIYQLNPIGDEIVAWMPLPDPYKGVNENG